MLQRNLMPPSSGAFIPKMARQFPRNNSKFIAYHLKNLKAQKTLLSFSMTQRFIDILLKTREQ
jgi:hypothetical protein